MSLRRVVTAVMAGVLAVVGFTAATAAADSQTTSNSPYTCTTSPSVGNQTATFSVTASDTVDPATPGTAETYRFVIPFSEAKTPVTATYQGGTTSIRIPTGFTVTSVSTQPPAGGSPISSTAAVQGDSIVITSTGNVPLDGTPHPTPDLIVNGTVTAAAAGIGVNWLVPYQIVATVAVQGFGTITATCAPDSPNTVIASTTVPGAANGPVATNQSVALPQGTSKAITLSATDPDTPLNQLVFAVATSPAHGTLTGSAPALTYAPAAGYVGADSFTFTVTDPHGAHSTGTVTINVFSSAVVDNTPPTISVTSPVNGAVFTPNQVVKAAYTCADATTGVKACVGTVANAAAISTTVGTHNFVVNASDNAKNPAQTTIAYRVVATALVKSAVTQIPTDCGSLQPLAPKSIPVAVSAPAQVGTSRSMTFRVALGSQSVAMLTTATNLRYVFSAPTNGTAQSAMVESGTGTANARSGATATIAAGKITLTLPGPITGGNTAATAFTPPAFDVTIVAAKTVGALIHTQFERFEEHTAIQAVTQDLNCPGGNSGQSKPNPILTSTTIIDTTPPVVLIGKPGNGDVDAQDATVNASFGCADDHSLATCVGTVANGAAINTSSAGIKTFVVHATDAAGNSAQQFVSYTVLAPTQTFTAHFANTPAQSALLDATAAHFNTTRANLPKVAVSYLAYLDSINPSLAHPVTPPASTGGIAIPTVYPRAQVAGVLALAGKWGLDGDEFHAWATQILEYVYSVS
jgi:Bacterial Ig domain